MTPLSDADWELINAWADNELPKAQMRHVDEKIKTNAAWSEAASSVKGLSAALGELRPEAPISANQNRGLWSIPLITGLAAACVFAAFLAFPARSLSPEDVHQSYLGKNFPLSHAREIQPVTAQVVDGFPILREANLTLVATAPDQEMSSAHYVGNNGCRLTLLKQKGTPFSRTEETLSHVWSRGEKHYLAVATDMDVNRFNAISAYLEATVGQENAPQQVAAVQDAVKTTAPCTIDQA